MIRRCGVIGCGQMGLGIALVAAREARTPVRLIDSSQKAIDKGLLFLDGLLQKDVKRERISSAQASEILGRIDTSTTMDRLGDVDMVIEAVPESPELKTSIFRQLANICSSDTVLATNTSSISITKIAAAAGPNAASRVIATHFMNPVPVQKGVEVIVGLQTSEETVKRARDFCERMGKIVSISQDSPGFIANRILMPYINEAIICLETGVGDKESIDGIMKNGCAMPMGPLALADFIGLDTCLSIMRVLHRETGDSKYRSSILLAKMVDAGWLGKKSGKGFYEYNE